MTTDQPRNALVHAQLALKAWDQNNLQDAESHAIRALDLLPRCALAYQALGLVAFRRAELDECVEKLKTALQIEPDLVPARNYLAVAFARRAGSNTNGAFVRDR